MLHRGHYFKRRMQRVMEVALVADAEQAHLRDAAVRDPWESVGYR